MVFCSHFAARRGIVVPLVLVVALGGRLNAQPTAPGDTPPVIEPVEGDWIAGRPAGARSLSAPLDQLDDSELIDLYIATYQGSLRAQVADNASLVEPGRLLIQTGYTYSYDRQAGLRNRTHTIPELLLRYRVLKRLELRAAWAGVTLDGIEDDVTGVSDWDTRLSDPSFGARLSLWGQRYWLPRTSVTISSPLNVESNVSLVNRMDPFVGVGYSWFLGERWLLSGNSAVVWTREGDDRFLDFQQSVSFDWLAGDRWSFYVEWSSLFPEGARVAGMSHTIGPGAALNLTRDLQLDVIVMAGMDDASPDFLTQVLLSWRL